MIVATTIIIIIAMLCGTFIYTFYLRLSHTEVNQYTLNHVMNMECEIRDDIRHIREQLKEQSNDK